MTKIYHVEYGGYYTMRTFDDQQDALKRWFDNYKLKISDYIWSDYQWGIVEEVPFRKKTRYVCVIQGDFLGLSQEVRRVLMEPTAPSPPLLTFAAKRKYVPPPPKTAQQLAEEREWDRQRHRFDHTMLRRYGEALLGPKSSPPPPTHRRNV